MFGKIEAASHETNHIGLTGIVSVLAAVRRRRRASKESQLAAEQAWLQGVVSTWSVGRSI